MRIIGFILALAVWLFVITYGLLAVTMGGCTAAEPGCDTTHSAGLATVGAFALLSFVALVWAFFLRRRRS